MSTYEPLYVDGRRDKVRRFINPSPDEIQIRTSGTLSSETMRAAFAIVAEHKAGGCSLIHKARYTMLKVRRGATDGDDSWRDEYLSLNNL